MKRHKMLMAVYNPIDFDGRVKRACEALAIDYDLTLLCLRGSGQYHSDRFEILRTPLATGFGSIGRLLVFWLAFLRAALRLRPDCVYANDFFLPVPGWVAARLVRARFVYDAHELIIPTAGQRMTPKEWLFYRLERWAVRRADLVIAANAERASVMQEHYGLTAAPIAVRNIPPAPRSRFGDSEVLDRYPGLRRSLPDDVHVIYMGDINLGRGLAVLFEALPFLPACFKIIFVGNGPDLGALRALAAKADERLRVIGPVPHAEVYDVVRQADIGFISYSMRSINEILCAPNKVIEYAQAGLPMVATCQPTIRSIFNAYPMGVLVGCGGEMTPRAVAGALIDVASARNGYASALGIFLKEHTWEKEATGLLQAAASACR
jgi:glycosyltransferase involved in cell wall biosynthesis